MRAARGGPLGRIGAALAWASSSSLRESAAAISRALARLAPKAGAAAPPAGACFEELADAAESVSAAAAAGLDRLGAEKAELRTTLANMVEGVASVDADGRLLDMNPAMERLFGVSAAAAHGRPFVESLRHSPLHALLSVALAERRPASGEIALFVPEEKILEAHANPILDAGDLKGAVLVLHDITSLRRLERMRRDFVANVSHELRTPLASIKGFAETLRLGGLEDEKNRLEFVETIERHAEGLSKMVDELMELSAVESGKRASAPEAVPLAAFCREVARGLAPLAQRARVEVSVDVSEGLSAWADRSQLRQVVSNLLDNAIKFNREGGTVEVSAAHAEDGVRISVSDTGPGIPAADLPRVFERFYRVDKARSRELGGAGLGLAIVKHIVEAHGGRVWAESVEGQGSVFHLALPARPPAA